MIDDMEYHVRAWTEILNQDLKANLSDKAIRGQMYGKNSELFDRIFGPSRFSPDEVDHWSMEKEKKYQQAFRPHLELIRGLDGFLKNARDQNIALAIGTAAIPFNVNFVLDNLDIAGYFQAIVTADDVKLSKPDPEVYLRCAELVGVDPAHCVVFEDAPKGVEAAQNAGMKSVVILSTLHGFDDFKEYNNILKYIHDYTEISPEEIVALLK